MEGWKEGGDEERTRRKERGGREGRRKRMEKERD
jgi:hypothetical protein